MARAEDLGLVRPRSQALPGNALRARLCLARPLVVPIPERDLPRVEPSRSQTSHARDCRAHEQYRYASLKWR